MTMASVKKSVLMGYLQCTLCTEDMQRSCILQCHHSFCVECLQKYMAQATDPQKMICPICRKVTTLPHGDLTNLPPNFFMDNLKELITKETDGDEDEGKMTASVEREMVICSLDDCQSEAIMYCTFCKSYLCDACTKEHAAARFTKNHETILAPEAKVKVTSSLKSHHPCGRHSNHMLDMYCETCEEIICSKCCKTEHGDHNFTTLRPFIKPCEERLDTLLKRIDKLLKCIDLARQTSQQQVDKAQHHIVSLKTQVTSTFSQIREKLAQQEERLMSDLERAATRVAKVALSTEDEQQLAEVNLESIRFLSQSLKEGDVYDQMSNLPSLEEAVEKRWRTEIPGLAWRDEDATKINIMSDVDNITLTETPHALQSIGDTLSDRIPLAEKVAGVSWYNIYEESGEDAKTASFQVGGLVCGTVLENDTIFLVKWKDPSVYMYTSGGIFKKKINLDVIKGACGLVLMNLKDHAKLILTTSNPYSLFHLPISGAGDTCVFSNTHLQSLNYEPWGISVNDENDNLIVTDRSNGSLHVYNSSGVEINTIQLPSGVIPMCFALCHSGGYVVTDFSSPIIWVDKLGVQQRRHQDKSLSDLRGVVRDSKNRYVVADRKNNQLLLFSKDGGDVRCLVKDKITKPYSLYLDQQQDKLYVGTDNGEVVVYDYCMLLGDKHIKYNVIQLDIMALPSMD